MAARLKIIYRIQTNETTSSVIKVCNRQRLQLERTVNNYESIESNENLLPMFSFVWFGTEVLPEQTLAYLSLGTKTCAPSDIRGREIHGWRKYISKPVGRQPPRIQYWKTAEFLRDPVTLWFTQGLYQYCFFVWVRVYWMVRFRWARWIWGVLNLLIISEYWNLEVQWERV